MERVHKVVKMLSVMKGISKLEYHCGAAVMIYFTKPLTRDRCHHMLQEFPLERI